MVGGNGRRREVIAIVDDEEMVLASLNSYLALETDYEVVTFTRPGAALEYVAGHDVDLVISDYYMPGGGGGKDVLREATGLPQPPKVIMATGSGNDDLVRDLLGAGADLCLEKPFGIRDLLAAIETVLAA